MDAAKDMIIVAMYDNVQVDLDANSNITVSNSLLKVLQGNKKIKAIATQKYHDLHRKYNDFQSRLNTFESDSAITGDVRRDFVFAKTVKDVQPQLHYLYR